MGSVIGEEGQKVVLPRYPLPTLEATTQHLLQATARFGSDEERLRILGAAAEFLSSDSVARKLQARLESLAQNSSWISEVYSDSVWLKERNWHPRCHNFYAFLPHSSSGQDPASRAAVITKAGYEYKKSLDAGLIAPDRQADLDLPQCMETVHWIFNSNRVPVLGCDRVESWPGNDHVIAMRNGHAFVVKLHEHGQTISYGKLRHIFQAIIHEAPSEPSWFSILTTANRDDWAQMRAEVIAFSEDNAKFISALETSLFTVCLEDGEPITSNDCYSAFVLDDNRNRWLDKTLSFIVAANGEAGLLCEHSKVDGTSLYGLGRAIINASSIVVETDEDTTRASPVVMEPREFVHLRATIPPSLSGCVDVLRSQHIDAVHGWATHHHALAGYSASSVRRHKMSPKSVVQVVIQAALRRHFGYSPNTMDGVSLRHFQGGRVDYFNAATDEIITFCDALWDQSEAAHNMKEHRMMLSEAVRSHAKLVSLVTWGRGWWRHTTLLAEQLQPGEELPALLKDPVYLRVKWEPKAYTTFLDFGLKDVGQCWPDRDVLFMSVCVLEHSVDITIINGNGRGNEFLMHLEEAATKIQEILNYHDM